MDVRRGTQTRALAQRLAIPTPHALGLLVNLLGAAAENQGDGVVREVRPDDLAEWAGWHGESATFAAAVHAILDDQGRLPGWDVVEARLDRLEQQRAAMRDARKRERLEREAHEKTDAATHKELRKEQEGEERERERRAIRHGDAHREVTVASPASPLPLCSSDSPFTDRLIREVPRMSGPAVDVQRRGALRAVACRPSR